jgi:hypothetical protein
MSIFFAARKINHYGRILQYFRGSILLTWMVRVPARARVCLRAVLQQVSDGAHAGAKQWRAAPEFAAAQAAFDKYHAKPDMV